MGKSCMIITCRWGRGPTSWSIDIDTDSIHAVHCSFEQDPTEVTTGSKLCLNPILTNHFHCKSWVVAAVHDGRVMMSLPCKVNSSGARTFFICVIEQLSVPKLKKGSGAQRWHLLVLCVRPSLEWNVLSKITWYLQQQDGRQKGMMGEGDVSPQETAPSHGLYDYVGNIGPRQYL